MLGSWLGFNDARIAGRRVTSFATIKPVPLTSKNAKRVRATRGGHGDGRGVLFEELIFSQTRKNPFADPIYPFQILHVGIYESRPDLFQHHGRCYTLRCFAAPH